MTKLAPPALILALVLLSACKKSSSSSSTPGGGTITATIDGTPTTFNNVLIAKDTAYMGAYVLTISGATSLNSSETAVSITVDGTSSIAAGTYSIGASGNTTDLPGLSYSQGSTFVYSTDVTGTYPSSVVITSISKTNVQGTFSGTLILGLGTGATTKSITNGKFDVNFK